MRKLLGIALFAVTFGFIAGTAEAKGAGATVAAAAGGAFYAAEGQWRDRDRDRRRQNERYERRNNNRVRVVTRTRLVRRGRAVYRETYQIRYLPNGRTQTRLINRIRVR
jgi:hypothetical protein